MTPTSRRLSSHSTRGLRKKCVVTRDGGGISLFGSLALAPSQKRKPSSRISRGCVRRCLPNKYVDLGGDLGPNQQPGAATEDK